MYHTLALREKRWFARRCEAFHQCENMDYR